MNNLVCPFCGEQDWDIIDETWDGDKVTDQCLCYKCHGYFTITYEAKPIRITPLERRDD